MSTKGIKIHNLNFKVVEGSGGKFKWLLEVEGISSQGLPAFTGATYDAEREQIVFDVKCPASPPPLPMHLVTPAIRQTGVYRDGEGWGYGCPYCAKTDYFDGEKAASKVRQALSSHIRQIHPSHWQQSGQSKTEID